MVGDDAAAAGGPDYALEPDAALLVTTFGHAFVLNMADRFYAIPPVGAAMLRQTLRRGEDSALSDIVDRYDVDQCVAQADLRRLLDDLRRRGVLRRRGDPPKSPPRAFGATLVAGLARRVPGTVRSATGQARAVLVLARVSFLLFGWSATLTAWRRLAPSRPARRRGETPDAIDDAVRSVAARLPLGASCKERALGAWAMARFAGLPATLIVGVVQHPLGAHAWCETANAKVLGDDAAICRRYLPVFRYD